MISVAGPRTDGRPGRLTNMAPCRRETLGLLNKSGAGMRVRAQVLRKSEARMRVRAQVLIKSEERMRVRARVLRKSEARMDSCQYDPYGHRQD